MRQVYKFLTHASIIALILTYLGSCTLQEEQTSNNNTNPLSRSLDYPKPIRVNGINARRRYDIDETITGYVLLIDSCEYIFIERESNGGPMLTHKGNCRFCRERHRRFLNDNGIVFTQKYNH